MKPIFSTRQAGNHEFLRGVAVFLQAGFFVSAVLMTELLSGQQPFEMTAPGKYRIVLKDKNNNSYSTNSPEEYLSERALWRRQKQGIGINSSDLPVTPAYIDSIRATGASILTVSKWFNAVTVSAQDDTILERIAGLSFVDTSALFYCTGQVVNSQNMKSFIMHMTDNPALNYGSSFWQTGIHKGEVLHENGYTGKGMIIAIIDAGFNMVMVNEAFKNLRDQGHVLGNHDFVEPGKNDYSGSYHGMYVLSVMGGELERNLLGTAPDAGYWLLRSEDIASEFLVEEDNWIAAAEFADSAGADIINSSLGYNVFNLSCQNHAYNDMNGDVTRISRAADMAASKGMLVVVSAGNEGDNPWQFITAPADADSVLAVGAVDDAGSVSSFSSHGPASDGVVKPDVMAIGVSTVMAGDFTGIQTGNGTSLAAPIISGLAACLWQANPDAKAMEVLAAIRKSADRFSHPDGYYGYGIPDFNLADALLKNHQGALMQEEDLMAFPNPFEDVLYVVFKTPDDAPVEVVLSDMTGKIVYSDIYPGFFQREYIEFGEELKYLSSGIYFLRIQTSGMEKIVKLIKK